MSARYAQKVESCNLGFKAGGTADNDDDIRLAAIIMSDYSHEADFYVIACRDFRRQFYCI